MRKFLVLLCWCSIWCKLVSASRELFQPNIQTPENVFSHKIVFPSGASSNKYSHLFEPTLPIPEIPKWFNRKAIKFGKSTQLKIAPTLRYNFAKTRILHSLHYPLGQADRSTLHKITQDTLRQTEHSLRSNKYQGEFHDPGIKPVVEHIEGDIKYDFRTKTHSYD